MQILNTNYFKPNTINFILLIFFPVFYILGPAVLNSYLFLISVYVLFKLKDFKHLDYDTKYFFLLCTVFVSIVFILSLIRNGFENNIIKSFSYVRFILFSYFITITLTEERQLRKLIYIFSTIGILVSLDVIYQDIFNYNILNFERHDTRLGGIFDDELIVGSFLFRLIFPALVVFYSFKIKFFKNKFLNLAFSSLTIFFVNYAVLISGERTASILLIFFTFIILIFFLEKKKVIVFILLIIILFITNLNKESYFLMRMIQTQNDIVNYFDGQYTLLQKSGFKVWRNNIFFGVGINNFERECEKLELNKINNYSPCSTHPHNTWVEILSETGLVGVILFILCLFSLLKNLELKKNKMKNYIFYFNLGHIVIIIAYILPFIPTGSFFSTMNATFFWFSVGILLSLKKINFKF